MPLVVLLALFLLAGLGLQLLNPQILRYFIDQAQLGSPLDRLVAAAIFFMGVAVTHQVVTVAATYLSEKVGWTATNTLRGDLARHALSLDMSFHNDHTPGEMIERIDGDPNELGMFFSSFVFEMLGNVLLLLGILVLLFREDWQAGIALGAFAGIGMATLMSLRNIAAPYWKANRQASADSFGFIEERLAGTEDIWSNNAKPYVVRRFHELMRSWYQKAVKAGLMSSFLFTTTFFLIGIGNALALALGAYLFLGDRITIGTVYLIFHYTNMLVWPINRFTQQMDNFQKASASIARILELLQVRSRVQDGNGAQFPAGPLSVAFEDVWFQYGHSDAVLNGISFDIRPGRTLGLLGRTGSGKTTMTRLLLRLYDPTRGKVRLGGTDIRETSLRELRQHISMVTQDVRLIHGTVRDNLTFFDRSIPDGRLLEVIEELGMMEWYDSLSKGLDTTLLADGGGLSAGEAQLLAFTRVFLKDSGLVILDEASSRLDRGTERLIERAVDSLVQGRTAIIVAHQLATVKRVDDIMILEEGRIVERGERRRLEDDPDSRFYGLLRTGLEEVLG